MSKKHRGRKTRKKRGAGCSCEKNKVDIKALYNLVELLPSVGSYAKAKSWLATQSASAGGRRTRRTRRTRRKRRRKSRRRRRR